MKKIILLLSLLLLILNSCSKSDDNETVNKNTYLLKKKVTSITNASGNPTFSIETNYQYIGNKIYKITSSTTDIIYTYTGNLISKIENFENNQISFSQILNYDNNNRIENFIVYNYQDNTAEKTTFTYTSNSIVNFEYFTGDFITQNNIQKSGKYYLNSEGEKIKTENFNLGVYQGKSEITYGDKNEVFKNVIGFNNNFHFFGSNKNTLTIKSFDANNNLVDDWIDSTTYDANGFPSSYSNTMSNGNISKTQFFY